MTDQNTPTAAEEVSPPPNWLLARYRRIRTRLAGFQQELEQDYALFQAGGKSWEVMEALRLRSRGAALGGLSDTFAGFAFNVPMGDFAEDEWQKVYADKGLVDGADVLFTVMEEQCDLYAEATMGVHREFAAMSRRGKRG